MNPLPSSEETVAFPTPVLIFEKRSARLSFLAPGHSIGAFLEAMARLAESQLSALQTQSPADTTAPPMLPFDVHHHLYGEDWFKALDVIVSGMQRTPLPAPAQAALSRLATAAPQALESSARAVLDGKCAGTDLAAAPFLAAALQVYWTGLASRVQGVAAERSIRVCPVCASPPVAGVVLRGRGLRYLCCSLCATRWYVPRLTCANCGSTAGVSYFTVDGDRSGTKAEACSACRSYLKLFYLETNPEAEAFADDLATLSLDLLMSDRSYGRSGANLFLLSRE